MACTLKALNGSTSILAGKISATIDDNKQIRNLHYKANTKEFSNWYGKAKRDSNGEPILNKNKDNTWFFKSESGDTMTLEMLDKTYTDAPLSVTDPLEDVRQAKQKLVDEGLTEEEAEQLMKEQEVITNIKIRLIKKKHKFERSKHGSKKVTEIDTILKELDGAKSTLAIHDYFSFALRESNTVLDRVEKILSKGGSLQELTFAVDYVNAFSNLSTIFDAVKGKNIPGSEDVFDRKYFDTIISPVIGRIDKIKTMYRENAAKELAEKLIQYNTNANLTMHDIQAMTAHVTGDINWFSYWMDSMAESDDQILALIDKMVKSERNKINQNMVEFKNGELKERLLELEEFQKSRGVNLSNYNAMYDFMLEYEVKDGTKRLTGNYLSANEVLKNVNNDVNDPRYKFAKMFEDNMHQAFAHLPDMYQGKMMQIPTILKSDAERTFEQGIGKAFVEGVKDSFNVRADDTDYGDKLVYTDENNNVVKFVPVNFVGQVGYDIHHSVKPTDLSLNLASSLMRFMTMAQNHSAMTELVPYLEAAKTLLAERNVEVKSGDKTLIDRALMREAGARQIVTKPGVQSNAYKMLNEYMDAHIYGEFRIDAGSIDLGVVKLDVNKVTDTLIKYTALNSLAFNVFSGTSNVAMGTLMNGIEGSSGFFFSSADFRGAIKEYTRLIPSLLKDASSRFTESQLGLFMDTFDIFQEFNENGEVLEYKNGLLRNGNKALHFMQNAGEHFIQTSHAIAMMKGHRIYDGKAVSYFEWLELTKNKKSKESKEEFEKLKNVYESIETIEEEVVEEGRKYKKKSIKINGLDQDESHAFAERIKGNYQHNHGNYARQDAPNINRRWAGKLLMLFRKWLKPGINRRFSKRYYDQRMAHEYEGNYVTTFNFMRALASDFQQLGLGMVMYWNTPQYQALSEWEKAQITKTFREAMFIISMMVIGPVLANLQADVPEEDRVWGISFAEFLANRMYQESVSYVNPKEFMKLLRSPTATMGMVDKGIKAISNFVGMETYKSGEHKGEYKAWYNFIDLIPVLNQFDKMMSIEDILKFQRM